LRVILFLDRKKNQNSELKLVRSSFCIEPLTREGIWWDLRHLLRGTDTSFWTTHIFLLLIFHSQLCRRQQRCAS
jgi:hypothetical protein